MLTPLHQAIKTNIQSASLVHIDETSHSRNDERLRWCWLVASDDLVYEKILYSRSTHSAKTVLNSDYCGIVVNDQYSGYNWLSQDKHQLCWLHVIRNLQQIADYSGKVRISEHSEQPFRYDPNTYFGLIRTHIPRLSEHF